MTSPKSDAELLAEAILQAFKDCTEDTPYFRGSLDHQSIDGTFDLVAVARALRSRLTAETGVRDGALETAAALAADIYQEQRAPVHRAAQHVAAAIRALKSPPAPKGE